jgi:hypothetical protein
MVEKILSLSSVHLETKIIVKIKKTRRFPYGKKHNLYLLLNDAKTKMSLDDVVQNRY